MPSTLGPSEAHLHRAAYYDGRSAVRHDVAVHLRVGALDIVTEDGDTLDRWLYDEVVFADQGSGGIRIGKLDSEARLIFQGAEAFDALRAHAPDMHTPQKRARHGMLLAVISTAAVLVGVYFAIPHLAAAVVSVTPWSYEIKIGKRYSASIVKILEKENGKGVCDDVAGSMALLKLVQGLSRHTNAPVSYEVNVLDIGAVNAMALPGGYIYVFRGLLEKAESESELAGALAHEMAHVDRRHPMHGLVRSYGLSLLSDMMFGGGSMGGVSSMVMMTSYSREAEEEADAVAVQTLERAGVGAKGFVDFFERLRAGEEKNILELPGFLSTHPDTGMRAKRAQAAVQSGRTILTETEWNELRAICG